jgi:hypothetical protein
LIWKPPPHYGTARACASKKQNMPSYLHFYERSSFYLTLGPRSTTSGLH